MRKKNFFIKFFISFAIIAVIIAALQFFTPHYGEEFESRFNLLDLSEIKEIIADYSKEFRSERGGFENDRFDIYAFSLRADSNLEGFKQCNPDTPRLLQSSFGVWLESEVDDDALKLKMEDLVRDRATKYLYLYSGAIRKMYLYNAEKNSGYCLLFSP